MGHKGGKSGNVSKIREYSTIERKAGNYNNTKVFIGLIGTVLIKEMSIFARHPKLEFVPT